MDNMIQKLGAVITALNNISVSGKQNLSNLIGSISVLEDVMKTLQMSESEKNKE